MPTKYQKSSACDEPTLQRKEAKSSRLIYWSNAFPFLRSLQDGSASAKGQSQGVNTG